VVASFDTRSTHPSSQLAESSAIQAVLPSILRWTPGRGKSHQSVG